MSALQSAPGVDTVQTVARHVVSSVQDKTGRVITLTGLVTWDVHMMTSRPCATHVYSQHCDIISYNNVNKHTHE